MKKLSDFKDSRGIEIAAKVLEVIMEILADNKNMEAQNEKSVLSMFSSFMANSPKQMMRIFAILSEKDEDSYHCNGAEAMTNMVVLANDPIIIGLFTSQGRKGDATSSGSASENIEE